MEALISRLAAFLSRYSLSLLSGLLMALSFPNIFHPDFFPAGAFVAWFCLLPLFCTLDGEAPEAAFKKGFVAGFFFFLLSTAWINHIKPMGPGAPPAWICLSAWLALFPACFAWGLARGREARLPWEAFWVPALWTLLEVARERLLSGYPWVSLGSSQAASRVWLGLAALTGVYGLHFCVALINLLAWQLWRRRSELLPGLLLTAALLALRIAFPLRVPSGPGIKVAVIQGNIDQDQAWTLAYRQELMASYSALMREAVDAGAKILVWPESAYPGFFDEFGPESETLRAFARHERVGLIVGSSLVDRQDPAYYNAAVMIDAQGNTADYRKRHLVPFGEYIPFRSLVPILDRLLTRLGLSDFRPGADEQPGFLLQGLAVSPEICYESVYSEKVRQSAGEANLMAVLTLDSWFGDSAAPRHHFSQAVLRAVENGFWVARSAATGISGFVAPDGKISGLVPLNERGWSLQEIPFLGQKTFYRRHGPWFIWLCALFLALPWFFRPKGL